MATSFTINSGSEIIDSYNNSILEITYFGAKFPSKYTVTITINAIGYVFEVIAQDSPTKLNLKNILKTLVNQDNFADGLTVGLRASALEVDLNLFQFFIIGVLTTFTDTTTESATSATSLAFKSVQQIDSYVNKNQSELQILNKTQLTTFKNYPFDIAFWIPSGASSSVFTFKNTRTNTTRNTSGAWEDNVARFLLSDGRFQATNSTYSNEAFFELRVLAMPGGVVLESPRTCSPCYYDWNETYLLPYTINTVQVSTETASNTIDLTIKVLDNQDGIYLKWFNEEGAWSYWLFNKIYVEQIKTQTRDSYRVDNTPLNETQLSELITGKDASNSIRLVYKNLEVYEMEYLKSVLTSPRVYLYNGSPGVRIQTNETAWQSVTISDGSFTIANTKNALMNIALVMNKNKYTQV